MSLHIVFFPFRKLFTYLFFFYLLSILKSTPNEQLFNKTIAFPFSRTISNLLRWHATHVENFLSKNWNISSVLSVFKYNPGKTNNKFIKLVNNFYPVISYRRVQKESDVVTRFIILYTVRSLVMVRNQLQMVKDTYKCNVFWHCRKFYFI